MQKKITVIAATPLFNGLSESQLQEICAIAVDRFYEKENTIFMEGDDGDGFYIVVSGKVKIYKVSLDGKEQILHIYGPGHPFGEVPVFSGQKFPANALCLTQSHLLFLPRIAFIDLITSHPSLALNMLAVLSMRLREFTIQIENLSLKEVPGRLATYLLYLSTEQEQPRKVHLPISKGQLASLLGTIPETLSRILTKMSQQGLIGVNGNEIMLQDHFKIKELSASGKR
jgi:CRP/FNR family transcriptional regulator, dissimilatory nitrate respiration regulator